MIICKRTTVSDPHFLQMVQELDHYLQTLYGEIQTDFNPFNTLKPIPYALVAYDYHVPVGCGAMKEFDPNTMELKRMYVKESYRGRGIGKALIQELEKWSMELNHTRCILETGPWQKEAIALYQKSGYNEIPKFGPYVNMDFSICFEHVLAPNN
jgi:putative acetyltransferase